MALGNINIITLTGTFRMENDTAASGTVSFTTPSEVIAISDPIGNLVIVPLTRTITLNASGSFSIPLLATNDPDVSPTGFTYEVTVNITNGKGPWTFSFELPYNAPGGTIDLADVTPSVSLPGNASYVLVGDFTALNARVTTIETLTTSSNYITTNVTMVTPGTFYDGPSLTLAAGTWLLTGTVQLTASSTAVRTFQAKLWNGTTTTSQSDVQTSVGTSPVVSVPVHLEGLVVPVSTTTYKISCTSTVANDVITATSPKQFNSRLIAIKIH